MFLTWNTTEWENDQVDVKQTESTKRISKKDVKFQSAENKNQSETVLETSKTQKQPNARRSNQERHEPGSWWPAAVVLLFSSQSEPQTYQQAVSSNDSFIRSEAMNDEYESLREYNTWSFVFRLKNLKSSFM